MQTQSLQEPNHNSNVKFELNNLSHDGGSNLFGKRGRRCKNWQGRGGAWKI